MNVSRYSPGGIVPLNPVPLLVLCLVWSISAGESLKRGDPAPPLEGPGVEWVETDATDDVTTKPLLLLFLKRDCLHSADAVKAVKAVHDRYPRLDRESRTILITSRLTVEGAARTYETPAHWRELDDRQDALYDAWNIIATPSAVVVDRESRIVGFHPGFSPSMADAIRRDLVRAIDGDAVADAVTPTPGIMTIQMGRALARRGLWERALGYYVQAAELEPLPPDIILEQAEILIELEQQEEALSLIDSLGPDHPHPDKADALRARALEEPDSDDKKTHAPPRIP